MSETDLAHDDDDDDDDGYTRIRLTQINQMILSFKFVHEVVTEGG